MIVFIDTNFFIQCNDISQIDWSIITEDEIVELYISRPVQKEIDKFKNEGNTRRSKKARKANTLFRDMLESEDCSKTEKIKSKTIKLRFSENYNTLELTKKFPYLDLTNPDDEIIGTMLLFNELHSEKAILLTNDTNPALTCKKCKVEFCFIPEEWLLKQENDEKDKVINQLQKEINDLVKKEPIIDLTMKYCKETNGIINVIDYIKVSEAKKQNIIDYEKTKNPKVTDFSNEIDYGEENDNIEINVESLFGITKKYFPPTKDEINEYFEEYDKWIDDIAEEIETFSNLTRISNKAVEFSLKLKNIGNKPVDNLLIKMELFNGARFFPPDYEKKEKRKLKIRSGPIPPKGELKIVGQHMMGLGAIRKKIEHLSMEPIMPSFPEIPKIINNYEKDINGFYWKNGMPKNFESEWSLKCEEFRHKEPEEEFDNFIYLHDNIDEIIMKVTVSGTNLIKPICEIYKVKLEYTEKKLDDEI